MTMTNLNEIIGKLKSAEEQLAEISNELTKVDFNKGQLIDLSEIPVIGDIVYIPQVNWDSNDNIKSATVQRKQISDIYRLRDTKDNRLELYFLLSEVDTPPICEWETPAQYGEEVSANLANWVFFFRKERALQRLHYSACLNDAHISLAIEIKRGVYHNVATSRTIYDLMLCDFIKQVDGQYVLTESGKLWLETMTQGG